MVCDAVIEDSRSRNKSLINMFNGILTPAVPARHDKMCAFVAFSGGRGSVPIALRLCYDPDYATDLLRFRAERFGKQLVDEGLQTLAGESDRTMMARWIANFFQGA